MMYEIQFETTSAVCDYQNDDGDYDDGDLFQFAMDDEKNVLIEFKKYFNKNQNELTSRSYKWKIGFDEFDSNNSSHANAYYDIVITSKNYSNMQLMQSFICDHVGFEYEDITINETNGK